MPRAKKTPDAEYLVTGANSKADMATGADFQSGRMLGGNVESAVPKEWADRAKKAWEYFVEEPLVKSGINCWMAFSIGSGPEIKSPNETEKKAADAESERLGVAQFVEDMCLQLLTKGTCIGYRRMDAKDKTRVAEIQCVNPVSCKLTYEDGQLTKCVQTADKKGAKPIELPPEQLFVRHWDAPKFAGSGNSMVVPAFEPIELLREYRRAERAIARRWTTPLRLIQVGGQFGTKTIIPTQQDLNKVRDLINKMDLKSGLVVPFYVKVETYGAEGQVLRVEQKVANAKEDIMIAMGLAKTLITGDGPNFATAQIALKKMATQIKKLAKMAREICAWVMDDWALREGMEGLTYSVDYLDPTDEIDYIKILIEMYDKGLVSKATVQKAMDLNPETEKGSIDTEANNARDGRVTGPLCNMVNSGLITPNEARKLLGLEPLKPSAAETAPSAGASWMADYANMTALAGETCAACANREGGLCAVMGIPREDTDQACRFRA
jgi:hypothetical protein